MNDHQKPSLLQDHCFHGSVIGVGVGLLAYYGMRTTMNTAVLSGAVAGTGSWAYMSKYGHPKFVDSLMGQTHEKHGIKDPRTKWRED